jgi:phosphate transport system protein
MCLLGVLASAIDRGGLMSVAQAYRVELQEVRERFLLMAGRVENMIAGAVTALNERDTEAARIVIAEDPLVNQDEREIDDLCISILARRNPMASELRFLTLALKMSTELERIGDLAVDVCQRAVWISNREPVRTHDAIPMMGKLTQAMVRDVIDAFVDHDAESARDVCEQDDRVDELYHLVTDDLLDWMKSGDVPLELGVKYQSVAKQLERIADHAVQIAELVVYLVEGRDNR